MDGYRWILLLAAFGGIGFGAITIAQTNQSRPPAQPLASLVRSPFESQVAASGLVEPAGEAVEIGAPLPGIITEIFVEAGQVVAAGAPLFRVDSRAAEAQKLIAQAELASAEAELKRLKSLPRPEDLPPAQARVEQAKAELSEAQARQDTAEAITDPRAMSREERARRLAAAAAARARLEQAKAELARLEAGAWEHELALARAKVEAAKARLQAVEVELDQRLIKAPFEGQVLQLGLRLGEYANPGARSPALLVFGRKERLHLRVDIDEFEAWRFDSSATAMAYPRGRAELAAKLKFLRKELLVLPKKQLTGESRERVDTRVMQVIYVFEDENFPVLVGQQLDVFIQAAATKAPSFDAAPSNGGLRK